MTAAIPASLLTYLQDALTSAARLRRPTARTFDLFVLRSKSHRSHALFPWATDTSINKVHAHEVLVTASEEGVPIYGLEAGVYTVAASKVALVYVSKVDTTGLLDPTGHPSPAATLTTAFIAHALAHPPHGCTSVRVHIFARAQDQYLFPGSIDNKHKRRLTDKELCRWWKRVLTEAAALVPSPQLFYLLPGYTYAESLPYVPATASDTKWNYGHPYDSLRPTMAGTTVRTLNDLIPAFPDDPKARFLASLTSTPVPPTGESGDYDDAHARASSSITASAELTASLAIERKRLAAVEGGADEFWERIGYRQECMDGHLTAFFVVAVELPPSLPSKEPPRLAVLERASYIHLWSRFHNVEYGVTEVARTAYERWKGDIEAACANDGVDVAKLRGSVPIETASEVVVKRPIEEAKPAVVTLQPRKKVKKA